MTGNSGALTGNYNTLDLSTLTVGTTNKATINQADYVSIIGSKTYDGNTTISATVAGVNSETFTASSATANSANASLNSITPATSFTAAGSLTGNSGALTGNYNTLDLSTLTVGTTNKATINQADYTSIIGSKTYDGNATISATVSGVNSETFTASSATAVSYTHLTLPTNREV